MSDQPHSSWAEVYDIAYQHSFGSFYDWPSPDLCTTLNERIWGKGIAVLLERRSWLRRSRSQLPQSGGIGSSCSHRLRSSWSARRTATGVAVERVACAPIAADQVRVTARGDVVVPASNVIVMAVEFVQRV